MAHFHAAQLCSSPPCKLHAGSKSATWADINCLASCPDLLQHQVCAAGPRPFYVAALPLPPSVGSQTQAGGGGSQLAAGGARGLSGGAIAGIALACLAALGLAGVLGYWCLRVRGQTLAAALAALPRAAALAAWARAGAAALATQAYALLVRLRLPHAAGALHNVLAVALRRPAPP